MLILAIGLVLFLGTHFVGAIPGARPALVAHLGETRFKLVYTALSLIGFALIIWGKIQAHPSDIIWTPPIWSRTVAMIAVPISLILLVSAYAPGHIKHTVRHPMLASVAVWSGAHLLANGESAAVMLFGGFFAWSVITFISAWSRERIPPDIKGWGGDLTAIVLGFLVAMIILRFHMNLFGIAVI